MITKFSTFLFSFWIITVSAQQNYQSIVASIFKNADTDFVEIIGKKLPETEAGYTEFESKVKLSDETDLIIKKIILQQLSITMFPRIGIRNPWKTQFIYISQNISQIQNLILSAKTWVMTELITKCPFFGKMTTILLS